MPNTLSELTEKILYLDTAEALIGMLSDVARDCGMQGFNLSLNGQSRDLLCVQGPSGGPLVKTEALTTPLTNPLTRIGRKRTAPFLWHLGKTPPRRTAKLAGQLAALDLTSGLCLPFHHSSGYYGTLNFATSDSGVLTPATCHMLNVAGRMCMLQGICVDAQLFVAMRDDIPSLAAISPQQREILIWVARGKTNREIGIITGTRHRTVDYHIQEILKKLRVISRAQAAALYIAATGQQPPH